MAVDPVDHSVYVGTLAVCRHQGSGRAPTSATPSPASTVPRRSSRRVPGPERSRDHGRSEQPHHRLLRRPRHRPLAIAGRRRELDQRRRDPGAERDRRPDRLPDRLRGYPFRRSAQEHRRRLDVGTDEQRAAFVRSRRSRGVLCDLSHGRRAGPLPEPRRAVRGHGGSTACSRARTAPKPGCRSTWESTIRESLGLGDRSGRPEHSSMRPRNSSVFKTTTGRRVDASTNAPEAGPPGPVAPAIDDCAVHSGDKSEIRAGFRDGSCRRCCSWRRGPAAPGSVTDGQMFTAPLATPRGAPSPARRSRSPVRAPPQRATTDATGDFHFLGLSPGDYSVALERTGFETVRADVTVALGNVVLSFIMPVAGVDGSGQVSGDAARLDNRGIETGATFGREGARGHSHDTGPLGHSAAGPRSADRQA